MLPLWVQIHMDVHLSHSPINLTLEFWEILDQITNLVQIILGMHKMAKAKGILLVAGSHLDKKIIGIIAILTIGISRGVPSHMRGLMKDTTEGTHPLHIHPPHH